MRQIEYIETGEDRPTQGQNAKCEGDRRTPLEAIRQMVEQQHESNDKTHVKIARGCTRTGDVQEDTPCKHAKNNSQYPVAISRMKQQRRPSKYRSNLHNTPKAFCQVLSGSNL